MSVTIKVKWNKEEYDVTIEEGSTVEVFKTQMWTLTSVPVDRQKYLGFAGGMLKDTDDILDKAKKLKAGAKVTMMGTAEGNQLKAPAEKFVFEEDLTPEEKAKILKEKKAEIVPPGLKNLGNTCYMNATLQCLSRVTELKNDLQGFAPSADRDVDAVLTAQMKNVTQQLENTTEAVVPLQLVMALRQRFPRFAEMQNGAYMQQDADECLKGLFTVMANTLKGSSGNNRIDELFGFQLSSKLKCLECDEEPPTESQELQRALICHLGTQTEPVSHLHQGVQLSLKEHIEKNSTVLGRNAQYEKSSTLASLPPYLVIQYARFGYQSANEWAGTSAAKVKLTRKCAFTKTFDMYDYTSDELKKKLSIGRVKRKEQEDAELEAARKALNMKGNVSKEAEAEKAKEGGSSSSAAEAKDVEMKDANEAKDVEMESQEEYETGYYELIAIVSHKGRTADGGHYVGWALATKADGKDVKEDRWCCFDDDTVHMYDWKDLVGLGVDLQGGKVDTQIAYLSFYRKVTVKDKGNVLGTKEEKKDDAAPAASS
eukprot:TRINITY_DN111740_c0_g1_i1.p1 TRINITY_DN111740_c0_g1~~TRINITY_DN111740_c0_g1_i1.p1  ORF type:complete len:541 (-),score=235.68 TRINITY_DN111740_c0_g1_i1:215-1837(-)